MIITQEPPALAALHRRLKQTFLSEGTAEHCLPLVIALSMVVIDIFVEGPSQRTLAKEDHPALA